MSEDILQRNKQNAPASDMSSARLTLLPGEWWWGGRLPTARRCRSAEPRIAATSPRPGDILCAPVLEAGASSRHVRFPPGHWLASDGMLIEGPSQLDVPATLESMPWWRRQVV